VATLSADSSAIIRLFKIAALGFLLAPLGFPGAVGAQEANPFSVPPELEPDVRFWVRVYTEVGTDQGLLHDSWNLELVYEVVRFDADTSLPERERQVAAAKARYAELLRRFAAGATENLSLHERRILRAFGDNARPAQFLDAIDRIRFQLGQADRFHEGLMRAEAWETHIARTLKERGVPAEIAALPHVESSFNPAAYSRVGAAGLWQFMPSTARRFMRVDGLVDERLDPYRATEAAANLMLYNYNLLGSWPLAVTAYNHGPGGLRRAQDELGTSDIAVIVKRYQGATFGFASRNFYVSFLAALEVDRNAEMFFGPITRLPDTQSTTVELPDYIPVEPLAKAFKVDIGALRVLNPALRPPIWDAERFVPRGYALRLPGMPPATEIAAAWARLPLTQRYLTQRSDATHRLRRGETLNAVAAKNGVTAARLLAANGWTEAPELQRGQVLRLPLPISRADKAAPGLAAVAEAAPPAAPPPAAPPTPASGASRPREPVSQRQAQSESLLPAAPPTGTSETTDYDVAADNTVIVRPDETIGHLADWSGVGPDTLRKLNRLHKGALVGLGRRIKLDLSLVSAAQFVAARREYHRQLQERFFAAHRISGTETYAIKRGDSLWIIAQQHQDLPLWLVVQYNPDVDFNDVRPGAKITLPLIVPINRQ
jgi:membrane-bound lytic murein transglycosylase D